MTALPRAPLLQVDGVVCSRGERALFAPVSFALMPGTVVWLRGANGSGKTTLLRALAGLSKPDAGTIAWAATERRVVHLGHANALKDDLAVGEALRFAIGLDNGARIRPSLLEGGVGDGAILPAQQSRGASRASAALARLGMAGHARVPVRTLSQGQRRRVALARLAAQREPRVWLLDEPFDALDANGIECVNALLADHAARGGGVVLTSHLPLAVEVPLRLDVALQAPAATPR